MDGRDRITDTLMRIFTPDTYGKNFGSPQDDPEGWARMVAHQARLRDATMQGLDMPPDPRAQGWGGAPQPSVLPKQWGRR
jgi:hypothetical protein